MFRTTPGIARQAASRLDGWVLLMAASAGLLAAHGWIPVKAAIGGFWLVDLHGIPVEADFTAFW